MLADDRVSDADRHDDISHNGGPGFGGNADSAETADLAAGLRRMCRTRRPDGGVDDRCPLDRSLGCTAMQQAAQRGAKSGLDGLIVRSADPLGVSNSREAL